MSFTVCADPPAELVSDPPPEEGHQGEAAELVCDPPPEVGRKGEACLNGEGGLNGVAFLNGETHLPAFSFELVA